MPSTPMTALPFRPHPAITSRIDHVGTERAPVIVIDNFVAEPEALVAHAASLAPFAPAEQTFYPGVRAPAPLDFVQGVHAYVEAACRAAFGLGAMTVTSGAWTYSLVTTPPSELTLRQRMAHIDSTNPGNLALLLYLCGEGMGGTGFYRHRTTGYESISEARYDAYEAALKADVTRLGEPVGYTDGDSALFERTAAYEAVFNRMLIYRGCGLHSADIGPDFAFDPDPRTGRLTLNLFLHFR